MDTIKIETIVRDTVYVIQQITEECSSDAEIISFTVMGISILLFLAFLIHVALTD